MISRPIGARGDQEFHAQRCGCAVVLSAHARKTGNTPARLASAGAQMEKPARKRTFGRTRRSLSRSGRRERLPMPPAVRSNVSGRYRSMASQPASQPYGALSVAKKENRLSLRLPRSPSPPFSSSADGRLAVPNKSMYRCLAGGMTVPTTRRSRWTPAPPAPGSLSSCRPLSHAGRPHLTSKRAGTQ